MTAETRPAQPSDLEVLRVLIAEHMLFEAYSNAVVGAPMGIAELLFGDVPSRLNCAVACDESDIPIGYATWTVDVSTWTATEYVYMDCLYLAKPARLGGIGQRMVTYIRDWARDRGISRLEWQTPVDNLGAIAFYDRIGATRLDKARYGLDSSIVDAAPLRGSE